MRKTIGFFVLLIGAVTLGSAQVDAGSLVGTVKGASGAVLAGITVTVLVHSLQGT